MKNKERRTKTKQGASHKKKPYKIHIKSYKTIQREKKTKNKKLCRNHVKTK